MSLLILKNSTRNLTLFLLYMVDLQQKLLLELKASQNICKQTNFYGILINSPVFKDFKLEFTCTRQYVLPRVYDHRRGAPSLDAWFVAVRYL